MKKTRGKDYYEHLVKWKNQLVEDTTWLTSTIIQEKWLYSGGPHGKDPMNAFCSLGV